MAEAAELDLTLIQADDWQALYINGKLSEQNHSVDWGWVLTYSLVGNTVRSYTSRWAQDYADEHGKFPCDLSDIPESSYDSPA